MVGGICAPSHRVGTSAGEPIVNGETQEGGIDLMWGPSFDRLYHKLKVLLLLSCNHMMQLIGYRK